VLEQKFARLPWKVLEETPEGLRERYLGREFPVESFTLAFDAETLLRAACKYGAALAHTMTLYRHLVALAGATELELEVSVDETESPTSPAEHYFIAAELRRLGVRWISLAPRYVGRFEKGVDYVGDLDLFEAEFSRHAAIARTLGPYKLSLHSGSDKFSIYPIVARETQGLVHLKTAGTSYLEALRATARMEPDIFRQILALAHERYPEDRASYHVSADPARVPQPHEVEDAQLPALLDHFDARQMLHVTFGSALDAHGAALKAVLSTHEEAHYAALEAHFLKHLRSFSCFS
jgi:hypothetical protein